MAYDNICKYLAEQYPVEFVRWLSGEDATTIQVLKTELSVEPIRADALTKKLGLKPRPSRTAFYSPLVVE